MMWSESGKVHSVNGSGHNNEMQKEERCEDGSLWIASRESGGVAIYSALRVTYRDAGACKISMQKANELGLPVDGFEGLQRFWNHFW